MTSATPANTGKKQERGQFRPGQSGNPAGRPSGARNKATIAVEALLDGEAESLTRKVLELAAAGDPAMLRFCLDRIAPPRKDRPVSFALPEMQSPEDAVKASAALVKAVATGELTPSEAAELSRVVEGYTRAVDLHEIEKRLAALEANKGNA
jgi:hypothetical protein